MEGFYGHKTCYELPPGFRFHPTDEELVTHYLSPKVLDCNFTTQAVGEVDFNKVEPWDLPWRAKIGEEEWYFYCLKDKKYPTGSRTNRATDAGYWKATGKDKEVFRNKMLVGMKKTLVFYSGRAPNGEKTNWVMHEYRLQRKKSTISPKKEWVICRIFKKSSRGNKVHISGLARSSYSHLDLPPLIDLSSDENIRNGGEGTHVTCFSNPKQDISSDEYSSSLVTSFVCPSSIFSAQLSPCTESLRCPGSILKQEQITNCYVDGFKLHDDDDDQGFPINFSGQIELDCLWSY